MIFIDTYAGLEPEDDRKEPEPWWESSKLTDFECRLFLFLCARMNDENEVRLMQDEIAAILHVRRIKVSLAITKMRELRLLATPRRSVIVIDPHRAWRDTLKKNAEIIQ